MNTSKSSRRRASIVEINVVPYIDIMLVLLIIFMVTTPLLTQGVKIQLPKAASQTIPTNKAHPIIVTVDVKGNYYLNIAANPSTPIDPMTLHNIVSAQIRSEQQQNQKPIVLVKGDNNANYGNVVQAMVLLQQAGASNVRLVTQPAKTS